MSTVPRCRVWLVLWIAFLLQGCAIHDWPDAVWEPPFLSHQSPPLQFRIPEEWKFIGRTDDRFQVGDLHVDHILYLFTRKRPYFRQLDLAILRSDFPLGEYLLRELRGKMVAEYRNLDVLSETPMEHQGYPSVRLVGICSGLEEGDLPQHLLAGILLLAHGSDLLMVRYLRDLDAPFPGKAAGPSRPLFERGLVAHPHFIEEFDGLCKGLEMGEATK